MSVAEDIPAEWRSILKRGESILWQGAPLTDTPYQPLSLISVLGGIALMIFTVLYGLQQSQEASGGGGQLFVVGVALAIAAYAFYMTIGHRMLATYKVRHSFYTLTTRRAFVGWWLFRWRMLDQWPIDATTKIELDEGSPGSVYFAERVHHSKTSSWVEKIGFHNIADARDVYQLMLEVQKRAA